MADQIALLLKQLRLPAFVAHYQSVWEIAVEQGWSHPDYLSELCQREVAERYQRRVATWTREAKLPAGKTFATFTMDDLDTPQQNQIVRLRDDHDWVRRAGNVLLFGPSGTGKTHLAVALCHRLIEQGIRVGHFAATALVQHLQQAKNALELSAALLRLDKYRVVLIDDIGYVKKTDAETSVLFEFIAHRYESGSLILTANQPFSQWDHIFPDNMMTVAAIDRLIHHATLIEMAGESYRKKHRQSQS